MPVYKLHEVNILAHADNEILRIVRLMAATKHQGWEEIIGDALRRIPGIGDVLVDAGQDSLLVRYDPTQTSPDQFINLAQQAGYTVNIVG